jgi:vanillate O-demethylase monooxygenase subunit
MIDAKHPLFPRDCSFSENNWAVLAKFWHAVAWSDEVMDGPMAVRLLDVPLVLFRDADREVVAAHNVCPHRGSLLSQGVVLNGNIQCPYHGLQFEGSGRCVHVPSNKPGAKIPEKLRLNLIAVREHANLIWVCLDGTRQVPLPGWPQLSDADLQNYHLPAIDATTSATRFCENFNDVSHFQFVHAGTFGGGCKEIVDDHSVRKTDAGLQFDIDIEQIDRVTLEGALGTTTSAKYSYDFTYPFSNKMHIRFDETRSQYIFAAVTPTSARTCRVHIQFARNFDFDEPIEKSLEFEAAVTAEDLRVIEKVSPAESPLDLSEEFHVPADRWSVAFRRTWKEYGLAQ